MAHPIPQALAGAAGMKRGRVGCNEGWMPKEKETQRGPLLRGSERLEMTLELILLSCSLLDNSVRIAWAKSQPVFNAPLAMPNMVRGCNCYIKLTVG